VLPREDRSGGTRQDALAAQCSEQAEPTEPLRELGCPYCGGCQVWGPYAQQVIKVRDALQQAVMLSALALEVMGNKGVVAERSVRLIPGSIPDASLAFVDTDSCTVPQSGAEGIVQGTSPFRQGDDVDVIEESEHSLTITKVPLQVADRVMLRRSVKRRASGKERVELASGKDGGARACFGGSAEQTADGFCPSAGAEAILVRHARLLELRYEVACEHATNQSPEGITDNEGSDSSIGLLLYRKECLDAGPCAEAPYTVWSDL
ncbi:unnamed protein product, partial [Symbiodinium sp. KB8]